MTGLAIDYVPLPRVPSGTEPLVGNRTLMGLVVEVTVVEGLATSTMSGSMCGVLRDLVRSEFHRSDAVCAVLDGEDQAFLREASLAPWAPDLTITATLWPKTIGVELRFIIDVDYRTADENPAAPVVIAVPHAPGQNPESRFKGAAREIVQRAGQWLARSNRTGAA